MSWGSGGWGQAGWGRGVYDALAVEGAAARDVPLTTLAKLVFVREAVRASDAPLGTTEINALVIEGASARDSIDMRDLWEPVDDNQTGPWVPVDDAQSGPWVPVVDAQSGTWVPVKKS